METVHAFQEKHIDDCLTHGYTGINMMDWKYLALTMLLLTWAVS